jgi:uncharacterized coiled-coil DUF342 family protein
MCFMRQDNKVQRFQRSVSKVKDREMEDRITALEQQIVSLSSALASLGTDIDEVRALIEHAPLVPVESQQEQPSMLP